MASSISIIGITGHKFNGKDTTADYIVSKYGYTKLSFAAPMKEAAKIIFGLTDKQVYGDEKEVIDSYWKITPREILQTFGTDCFRDTFGNKFPHIGKQFWIMSAKRQLDKLIDSGIHKIVIADVRFPNEVDFIKSYGGKIFKVTRDLNKQQLFSSHSSEASIDTIVFDKLFHNNGTIDDLHNKIDEVLTNI